MASSIVLLPPNIGVFLNPPRGFDSLKGVGGGSRGESELGFVTIRGFNLQQAAGAGRDPRSWTFKVGGSELFCIDIIADMGHSDVTLETGVTTVQSLSDSVATISLGRIPPSVGLYTALCTLLLIHISNNIMS